jgi:hypothetical protein
VHRRGRFTGPALFIGEDDDVRLFPGHGLGAILP